MRTTIDLPDDLLRRAKAAAAIKGIKLKEFIAVALERGLVDQAPPALKRFGRNEPPPVMIADESVVISAKTNAEIFELLDREDDEPHGRPA